MINEKTLQDLLEWVEHMEEKAEKLAPFKDVEIWDGQQTLQHGRATAFSDVGSMIKKVLKVSAAPKSGTK